jgi:hypothetical protein
MSSIQNSFSALSRVEFQGFFANGGEASQEAKTYRCDDASTASASVPDDAVLSLAPKSSIGANRTIQANRVRVTPSTVSVRRTLEMDKTFKFGTKAFRQGCIAAGWCYR